LLRAGNSSGTGRHHDSLLQDGARPLTLANGLAGLAGNIRTAIGQLLVSLAIWFRLIWNGDSPKNGDEAAAAINWNNALLVYLQNEVVYFLYIYNQQLVVLELSKWLLMHDAMRYLL
jgi:nitrate/nitrite transporter NarK